MDHQLLYKKSLRGPLQIISYYIKNHSAGPSVNVDIFLAKVKIVRLQVFSYYIKKRSAGPPELALLAGSRIQKRASVPRGRSGPKNVIFIIPEPDDKARQKIDLKFFGRLWIISYYIKSLSAGPSRSSVII